MGKQVYIPKGDVAGLRWGDVWTEGTLTGVILLSPHIKERTRFSQRAKA